MKTTGKLSRASTIAMIAVALMIAGVFLFPLWVISLVAPQYPQGLGLLIHIDGIKGVTPHDLQNINGLNHYIGMHKIEPGVIKELRYMKYFAGGLALAAALVALIRRRAALVAWVVIALVLAGVGMYDFYRWEYHYGHDLDPSAAIKVPGMTYQPPMFGTRQMLNFRATAWPGVGGWLAMTAVALGVLCLAYEFRLRRRGPRLPARAIPHPAAPVTAAFLLCIVATLTLTSCAKRPAAIAFGTDVCEQCGMTIADQRYGAEFVTDKGRTHKFDSVECMMESMKPQGKFADVAVHSFHVIDYSRPGTIVDATRAVYLVSPNLPSPMGANVTAFGARSGADSVQTARGGEVFDWSAVRDRLRSQS